MLRVSSEVLYLLPVSGAPASSPAKSFEDVGVSIWCLCACALSPVSIGHHGSI